MQQAGQRSSADSKSAEHLPVGQAGECVAILGALAFKASEDLFLGAGAS